MNRPPLDQQLKYMYGLERFGMRFGLDVMHQLMSALNNPHTSYPTIHITGTNGKGSTASFIASSLQAAGLKVGLYTSPHLVRFNERIQINGQPITDESLGDLVAYIRQTTTTHQIEATFFEFTTAVAFLYFSHRKVDIAVIEVGLGGRLDATNVITPLVSVITNIGTDHTQILGTSHQDIAHEKVGIVKPGVPVVTAETDPAIIRIFQQVSHTKKSTLYQIQDHLQATVLHTTLDQQTFATHGFFNDEFTIALRGEHQITNASTALVALHLLQQQGLPLSLDQIKQGLAQTRWPGRLDIISRTPFILMDGAHNPEGIAALCHFLDTAPLLPADTLLFAAKKDKDIDTMMKNLVRRFKKVIVTEGNFQPYPAHELAEHIRTLHPQVQAIANVAQALSTAQQQLTPGGMLLITGSLYMVGDVMAILKNQELFFISAVNTSVLSS